MTVEGVVVDMIGAQSVGLAGAATSFVVGVDNTPTAGEVLVKNRWRSTRQVEGPHGMFAGSYSAGESSDGVAQVATSTLRVENLGSVDTSGIYSRGIFAEAESDATVLDGQGTAYAVAETVMSKAPWFRRKVLAVLGSLQ